MQQGNGLCAASHACRCICFQKPSFSCVSNQSTCCSSNASHTGWAQLPGGLPSPPADESSTLWPAAHHSLCVGPPAVLQTTHLPGHLHTSLTAQHPHHHGLLSTRGGRLFGCFWRLLRPAHPHLGTAYDGLGCAVAGWCRALCDELFCLLPRKYAFPDSGHCGAEHSWSSLVAAKLFGMTLALTRFVRACAGLAGRQGVVILLQGVCNAGVCMTRVVQVACT